MLIFYSGTDTEKLRAKLNAAIAKTNSEVVRITDAHSLHDLHAALGGAGMFAIGKRIVVLDNVLANPEMSEVVLARLPRIAKESDTYVLVASEMNAATRKMIEKYAEKSERFDAAKGTKEETVFALANALQAGKKKDLWVGYRREMAGGKSPESIHGVLFWAAKQQVLRSPADARAKRLVARLAELPHEARRAGFDMEYALEHFVLALS
jgi:LmbE family N-acetylglucosaminyl deacetylase